MAARSVLTVGVVVAAALAALLAAGYWVIFGALQQPDRKLVEALSEPPQLHCVMIGYTGQPRVAFLFDMSQVGEGLHFEQRYLVEIRGADKTKKEPPFPEWRFDPSAEPARLESEINVFDNSAAGSHVEKITIELYGYRPERSNGELIEAGLKSIHYQNLSGNCQQSRPVPAVKRSSL